MQTKFKWNSKQRLLIIGNMSMSIGMAATYPQMVSILAKDIYFFATADANKINEDERMQEKLKKVFEMCSSLGVTTVYDELVLIEKEKESDEIGFSA